MFAPRPFIYDWAAIPRFYESGRTVGECRERFGFSNGAWHRAIRRGDAVPRAESRSAPRGQTRRAIEALHARNLSPAEIARTLGVSAPTVCYHLRRLGVPARGDLARRCDWDEIRRHYEAGLSATECRERFGFSRNAWADAIRRGAIEVRPRLMPLESMLVAGRHRSRFHLKTRLLLAGIKTDACEACRLRQWRGKPISLELHHVNGDGTDNRLENLTLLCPNCHCQTDTWGGRNKARRTAGVARSA